MGPEPRYSKIRVAIPGNNPIKWLFHFRGPRGQVFVRGVEVKATFKDFNKGTYTLILL